MSAADTLASYAIIISIVAVVISIVAATYSRRQARAAESAVSPFINIERVYQPSNRPSYDNFDSMSIVVSNHGQGIAQIKEISTEEKGKLVKLDSYSSTFLRQMKAQERLTIEKISAGRIMKKDDIIEIFKVNIIGLNRSEKEEYWRQFESLSIRLSFKNEMGKESYVDLK